MVPYQWMADLEGVVVFPWYALRVHSNFERAVSESLGSKGYPEFLPTYRARRRFWMRSGSTLPNPVRRREAKLTNLCGQVSRSR
jgi:hypothetical protein